MRVFKEEQRFNQLWIIILIVVSMVVPLVIIITSYIKNPDQYTALEFVFIILLILLASGFIFFFKLTTRIDENGIHYQFFPFHLKLKTILWQDIDKAYVRKYDALSEYGGWGLKGGALWNTSKGVAINVSGDIGIQLERKNGKKLLIGTQKEHDAKNIINTYASKFKNTDHA